MNTLLSRSEKCAGPHSVAQTALRSVWQTQFSCFCPRRSHCLVGTASGLLWDRRLWSSHVWVLELVKTTQPGRLPVVSVLLWETQHFDWLVIAKGVPNLYLKTIFTWKSNKHATNPLFPFCVLDSVSHEMVRSPKGWLCYCENWEAFHVYDR